MVVHRGQHTELQNRKDEMELDLEGQAKNTQQSPCSKQAQSSGGLPAQSWKCTSYVQERDYPKGESKKLLRR